MGEDRNVPTPQGREVTVEGIVAIAGLGFDGGGATAAGFEIKAGRTAETGGLAVKVARIEGDSCPMGSLSL